MDNAVGNGPGAPELNDQVAAAAERFRQAWHAAGASVAGMDLTRFLPAAGDPARLPVLQELVRIDLEIRGERGQPVSLEDYLSRFPELGPPAAISPDLVYQEFRIRCLHGDNPPVATYEQRFPTQFPKLKWLLESMPLPTLTRLAPAQAPAPPPPTAPPEASRTPTNPGEYKRTKRIGMGAFGEVWRAEAPGGVEVAVKIILRPIDHEDARREQQSLELIKGLRHPFLLQTQAFWLQDDRLWIVMELADGSLRERLKECRKAGGTGIPRDELLSYFREAAEALDFLHARHVIHRDIKPENILLLEGHAKVADFGLARLQSFQRSMTASGSGTPAYMAPEIWSGKVSAASDQYSLAIMYAELRLGQRPFSADDMAHLMMHHLKSLPELGDLPADEKDVICKALAKNPAQRYPNCREFVQALERAAGIQTARTGPPRLNHLSAGGEQSRDTSLQRRSEFQESFDPTDRDAADPSVGGVLTALPSELRAGEPVVKQQSVGASPSIGRRRRRKRLLSLVALAFVGAAVLTVYFVRNGSWKGIPLEPQVDFLPPNYVQGEGADIVVVQGKKYYGQIDAAYPWAKTRIPFLLIPKQRVEDPETFYIMRDKVTVGLFKKFASSRPSLKDDQWQLGGLRNGEDTKNDNDQHPVFRVHVEDAYVFARSLDGDLPSAQQWDKAAGRFEPNARDGPFEGTWTSEGDPSKAQIAVNRGREGPLPVGMATKDKSEFGIRDMAGNGREWTHEIFAAFGAVKRVPITNPDALRDRVIVRSRSYLEPEPLRFSDPLFGNTPDTVGYTDRKYDVGFRVVINIPRP